jgi:diguanylate cyclase (GGDEF)-like protein
LTYQSDQLLGELSAHLDHAREVLHRLSNQESHGDNGHPPMDLGAKPALRYKEAERRANVAEVRVAKLTRELEETRRATSASARDVQRLAYQDPLTGLANAHLLLELTDKILGSTSGKRQVLVIIVDVDRFCVLNQMLGHDLADDLLIRVGERLLGLSDAQAALGRVSEDEFALVVSDLPTAEGNNRALALGRKVRQQLSRPFLVQGQEISLTVSQGAALGSGQSGSGQSGSARELFAQARTALAFAKEQGRDQMHIYNPELDRRLRRDATVEFQLRYALENDEFFLEYLPTIWLESAANGQVEGRLIGVEALLRWRHRSEGVLVPADFLLAAERSGQIVPIGDKMIAQVCRHFQSWQSDGADLFVNINLSARQLLASDFVEKTIREVDQAGVPRERLTFEYHESFSRLNDEHIDQNLAALQAAGFTLALNNFGGGLFSLQRLQQVQFLKLSPNLVQGCPQLCRQALVIAAGLGKVAIGVGVETTETARFLVENGCPTVQGFYFSKPVEPTEVLTMYRSKNTWKV